MLNAHLLFFLSTHPKHRRRSIGLWLSKYCAVMVRRKLNQASQLEPCRLDNRSNLLRRHAHFGLGSAWLVEHGGLLTGDLVPVDNGEATAWPKHLRHALGQCGLVRNAVERIGNQDVVDLVRNQFGNCRARQRKTTQ